MKAHSSTYLTSSWSLRAALAAAFLASTACSSGDDTTSTPATDSGSDVTTTTPVDSGSDSTIPDTGTTPDAGTTPDTGATPDTGTTAETGTADASDGGAAGPLSFSKDIYPIVGAHCAGCHGVGTIPPAADAGPEAGPTNGFGYIRGLLDLGDASAAWASLVGDGGVPAQGSGAVPGDDAGETCATLGEGGLLRVAVDDAGGSLFANKVAAKEEAGTTTVFCGNPMPNPPAAPALDPSQVALIMTWISQGAKP